MNAQNQFEEAIRALIEAVGDDPTRDGVTETPHRVWRAWQELCGGYQVDVDAMMKLFPAEGADEIIVVRDISFTSICEHHLLPFTGKAALAYIPTGSIVGLSKIPRLVDAFARRLQTQEQLTLQIADTFQRLVQPMGTMVVIESTHSCAAIRGVKQSGLVMTTSCIRGVFRLNPTAKQEALTLIKGS